MRVNRDWATEIVKQKEPRDLDPSAWWLQSQSGVRDHASGFFVVDDGVLVSNIAYFGEPVYIYSLKQGIDDGFLAPYKVIRIGYLPGHEVIYPV